MNVTNITTSLFPNGGLPCELEKQIISYLGFRDVQTLQVSKAWHHSVNQSLKEKISLRVKELALAYINEMIKARVFESGNPYDIPPGELYNLWFVLERSTGKIKNYRIMERGCGSIGNIKIPPNDTRYFLGVMKNSLRIHWGYDEIFTFTASKRGEKSRTDYSTILSPINREKTFLSVTCFADRVANEILLTLNKASLLAWQRFKENEASLEIEKPVSTNFYDSKRWNRLFYEHDGISTELCQMASQMSEEECQP